MSTKETTTICGNQIQHDASGVGAAWSDIAREGLPANIVMEIEGEMVDGGQDACDDYVASNGLLYRW